MQTVPNGPLIFFRSFAFLPCARFGLKRATIYLTQERSNGDASLGVGRYHKSAPALEPPRSGDYISDRIDHQEAAMARKPARARASTPAKPTSGDRDRIVAAF